METMERHLVKIFLQEISRPPGPEMENAVNRESHSLAAGFALGFVLLAVVIVFHPSNDLSFVIY